MDSYYILEMICTKCKHVQKVKPAAIFEDGSAIYGSAADHCDVCDSFVVARDTKVRKLLNDL
jgi:hypothetical protein